MRPRYGRQFFHNLFLLPGARLEDARRVAGKIAAIVESRHEALEADFSVGISIGIAQYPIHGREAYTLLKCADDAMYHAKRLRLGTAEGDATPQEEGFG